MIWTCIRSMAWRCHCRITVTVVEHRFRTTSHKNLPERRKFFCEAYLLSHTWLYFFIFYSLLLCSALQHFQSFQPFVVFHIHYIIFQENPLPRDRLSELRKHISHISFCIEWERKCEQNIINSLAPCRESLRQDGRSLKAAVGCRGWQVASISSAFTLALDLSRILIRILLVSHSAVSFINQISHKLNHFCSASVL